MKQVAEETSFNVLKKDLWQGINRLNRQIQLTLCIVANRHSKVELRCHHFFTPVCRETQRMPKYTVRRLVSSGVTIVHEKPEWKKKRQEVIDASLPSSAAVLVQSLKMRERISAAQQNPFPSVRDSKPTTRKKESYIQAFFSSLFPLTFIFHTFLFNRYFQHRLYWVVLGLDELLVPLMTVDNNQFLCIVSTRVRQSYLVGLTCTSQIYPTKEKERQDILSICSSCSSGGEV